MELFDDDTRNNPLQVAAKLGNNYDFLWAPIISINFLINSWKKHQAKL